MTIVTIRHRCDSATVVYQTYVDESVTNHLAAAVEQAVEDGADLRWADLRGVDLSGLTIQQANLAWADLSGAVLDGTNLRSSILANASLVNASLKQAILRDANLHNADFNQADLSYCDCRNAYFRGTRLATAQQEGIRFTPSGKKLNPELAQ